MLLAVTPTGKCVGVRIFPQSPRKRKRIIEKYIDNKLESARKIKNQIEAGVFRDFENPVIVENLQSTDIVNLEHVIECQLQC